MKRSFHRALLTGVSPLAVLVLTTGSPAYAACNNVAANSELWTLNGDCTIATSGGNITQGASAVNPQATPVQMIHLGVNTLNLTVNAGAGIVNGLSEGQTGSAISADPHVGDAAGGIRTINNSGTIGTTSARSGSAIHLAQDVSATIYNGTTAAGNGATIANFRTSGSSNAIIVGGNGANEDTLKESTTGSVGIYNGSSVSSGNILNYSTQADAAAIEAHLMSGSIAVVNTQGTIRGQVGLALNSSGQITINNGNGTQVGRIVGDGTHGAIVVAFPDEQGGSLAPNLSITNYYGSVIQSNGDNSSAISVMARLKTGANQITNYGSIIGGHDGSAIDLGSVPSGGAMTVTNFGNITGDVKLGISTGSDEVLNLERGSVLTGNVIAPVENKGSVFVGAYGFGVATITGNLGSENAPLHKVVIENGATLAFTQDSEIRAGALSNSGIGAMDFGTSTISYSHYGALNVADEAAPGKMYYKTTINTITDKHGYFVQAQASGARVPVMYSNAAPIIVPTVVGSVVLGSRYVIVQDTDPLGKTVAHMPSVVNSSGVRWAVSSVIGSGQTDSDGVSYGNGATNILLTAAGLNKSGAATGTNGNAVKALAISGGGSTALQSLSNAANLLTSDADVEKAGAQLRPEVNGGTTQASLGAVHQALGTIQLRADNVRLAAAETGMSSGETLKGLGVWGQGFGSTATQGRRQDVDGYGADTFGLAFGADARIIAPLRLGASFAYARTNVADAGSRDGSGQKIASYVGSLYGTYSAKKWYVDGALTYGVHSYDSTRVVNFNGATAQTARADYSGQQYGAKAEFGVPLTVGAAIVTPLASLAYNRLNQNAYTETGAAGANLAVDGSTADSFRSGLGAKVSATVAKVGTWNIKPNARAVWLHEFNGSAPDQTSTFVAGSSSFTTTGIKVASEHLNLGIGVDVASVRNTTLSAKYDVDFSESFVSHTGSLQLRTEF